MRRSWKRMHTYFGGCIGALRPCHVTNRVIDERNRGRQGRTAAPNDFTLPRMSGRRCASFSPFFSIYLSLFMAHAFSIWHMTRIACTAWHTRWKRKKKFHSLHGTLPHFCRTYALTEIRQKKRGRTKREKIKKFHAPSKMYQFYPSVKIPNDGLPSIWVSDDLWRYMDSLLLSRTLCICSSRYEIRDVDISI